MKIAFGNDHAAREVRAELIEYAKSLGHEVVDYGYAGDGSADYPVYARKVANAVVNGEADCGILVCGTGIGMAIAANKVHGIRCAVCNDPYSATMAHEHNDANVIAVGARVVGEDTAKLLVDTFLATEHEGGRHARRVALIDSLPME